MEDATEEIYIPDDDDSAAEMSGLGLAGASAGISAQTLGHLPASATVGLVQKCPDGGQVTTVVPMQDLLAKLCGRVSQVAGEVAPDSHANYIQIEVPAIVTTHDDDEPVPTWSQAEASFASPGKSCNWMLTSGVKKSRAMHTQSHLGAAIHAFARRSGDPV